MDQAKTLPLNGSSADLGRYAIGIRDGPHAIGRSMFDWHTPYTKINTIFHHHNQPRPLNCSISEVHKYI